MRDAATIPVIAAIGEWADRPEVFARALDPVSLMAQAARQADAEAGGKLLARVDALHVVNLISWPYAAPADALCSALGITPATRGYGPVGGETPLGFLQTAAQRVQSGQSAVALICGGEAHRSAAQAQRHGVPPGWPKAAANAPPSVRSQDIARPIARQLGIDIPITVYPLFENAQNHRWGLSPRAALEETERLWSAFSAIAADNPLAAIRAPVPPEAIGAPDAGNRMLAWPYRKLMVANINVNQAAAIIVMSLEVARACELDDGRLIFLEYGNGAQEPDDCLSRADFATNPARDAVLEDAARQYDAPFDAVELYSCFPCVPKAARRVLGLTEEAQLTQAGGLTFFGAPLNNYMSHATCAMVRRLRQGGGRGLLYGQGGVATKHRALILSAEPENSARNLEVSVQPQADARRGPVPPFVDDAQGVGTIETFTVIHDGARRSGVVVVRTADNKRSAAAVVDDDALLDRLESLDESPIGMTGRLGRDAAGVPCWSA